MFLPALATPIELNSPIARIQRVLIRPTEYSRVARGSPQQNLRLLAVSDHQASHAMQATCAMSPCAISARLGASRRNASVVNSPTLSLRPHLAVKRTSRHGMMVPASPDNEPLRFAAAGPASTSMALSPLPPLPSSPLSLEQQPPMWQLLVRGLARWAGMLGLAVVLAFSSPLAAWAARSGGRVGGSSFSRSSYSSRSGSSSGASSHGSGASRSSSWGGGGSSSWGGSKSSGGSSFGGLFGGGKSSGGGGLFGGGSSTVARSSSTSHSAPAPTKSCGSSSLYGGSSSYSTSSVTASSFGGGNSFNFFGGGAGRSSGSSRFALTSSPAASSPAVSAPSKPPAAASQPKRSSAAAVAGKTDAPRSVKTNAFFLSPFGYGDTGGGFLLPLLFWGAFAVILLQVAQGVMRNNEGGRDEYSYGGGNSEGYEEVVTVAKVQVGLMANARELQKDLERIADKADTDSPEGLHYILQETVLALMRNPDYCLYGFAKSKRERCAEDAETAFNQLSLQERTKFEKETRLNVGGRKGRSSLKDKKPYAENGGQKELIVVTLIAAADGGFKMPTVDSRTSLKQALSMMGAIRTDDLLAVEVLWTPEEEDDHFTQEDLAYDYPTLNTL